MMPPARCDAIDRLNETLVVKALGERLVRTHRVRAETTVVEANVSYPTNSGLLPKAVTKIVRIIKRIKTAGGVTRARLRNRTRSAGRRLREISAFVRRRTDQARDDVLATTGRLAELAGRTVGDARRVLTNARRGLRRGRGSPRLGRIIGELADAIETIIDQTRRRLAGAMPARADRVVSLHDRDARPIPKGRIDRPVEFGYKAQPVTTTTASSSTTASTKPTRPMGRLLPRSDASAAAPARHPRAVTADRGYGGAKVEAALQDLGVTHIVLPCKGRPSKTRQTIEHQRSFRRLVKWRTGSEAASHTSNTPGPWTPPSQTAPTEPTPGAAGRS